MKLKDIQNLTRLDVVAMSDFMYFDSVTYSKFMELYKEEYFLIYKVYCNTDSITVMKDGVSQTGNGPIVFRALLMQLPL